MTSRIRILVLMAAAFSAMGCHRNRYPYIDVASSELEVRRLQETFKSLPDSAARAEYMRSQGYRAADILVYSGEDSAGKAPDSVRKHEIPYGYAADTVGTEDILHHVGVAYSRLVTDGGKNYRALYLSENTRRMPMPVLFKITEMAEKGALIGGARPLMPSEEEEDREQFDLIVNKIWNNGNVLSGKTIESLLRASGVPKDVKTRTAGLALEHRHLQHAEIYCVGSPSDHSLRVKLKCRVTGRRPLLFCPGSGDIRDVTYKIKRNKTKVTVYLDPHETVFIVFGPYAAHHKRHYTYK